MSCAPRLAPPPSRTPRPLTGGEFRGLQSFIYREAGIFLNESKQALLVSRLGKRLRALGLDSFGGYLEHLERDAEERVQLLDCISTNETHFFREAGHFELLAQKLVPRWKAEAAAGRRPRQLDIWSAGCSTGEEPYTMAMVLLDLLEPRTGWSVRVLGTDISTRVLEQARQGVWPIRKAEEIPERYLKRFMLRGVGAREGQLKAGPELRAAVELARLNLNDGQLTAGRRFDVIFCRNVLIYFDQASRERAVSRLLGHLAPGGYFFLGHAESLSRMASQARAVVPTVYQLAPALAAQRATGKEKACSLAKTSG